MEEEKENLNNEATQEGETVQAEVETSAGDVPTEVVVEEIKAKVEEESIKKEFAPTKDRGFTSSRVVGIGQAENVKAYKKKVKGPAHAMKRRSRLSEYGSQLKEKQEVRRTYGVREKQFANYVKKAQNSLDKTVPSSMKIYLSLESRLDNVVFRTGLAKTRPLARQMVSHGHIFVNGRRINIPSHSVRIGDILNVREGSKLTKLFTDIKDRTKEEFAPDWLKFDINKLEAKVESMPKSIDEGYDFAKIIELYSK